MSIAARLLRAWWLLPAVLLVSGCACDNSTAKLRDYQIVVIGSSTPVPVRYTGSYTFVVNGEERVRDLSGTGSSSISFQGGELKRVRLQVSSDAGLAAITVYENGRVIFDAPPVDAQKPILFTNDGS
ncbi:MAG: hypothetical protein HKN70_02895 [Gammaproteobacteria bacterium]|nr:hypothetical protein [Gammaproteobacteria bacterium]